MHEALMTMKANVTRREGQRCPSHGTVMTTHVTATTTAEARPQTPCGPAELETSPSGMTPKINVVAAMARHTGRHRSWAASSAVNR
jgi:hypothetical protein